MIEIELKFPVSSLEVIRQQFIAMGARPRSVSDHSDEYWNDPLRDFAKLDVALRIRAFDGNYVLTYKGPNLDPTAKIRREIETRLDGASSADQVREIFAGIGFRSVATVVKRREELLLEFNGRNVHVCLDDVTEVGQFIELELVVEETDDRAPAKQALQELAAELGLNEPIKTSYLELLLRSRVPR